MWIFIYNQSKLILLDFDMKKEMIKIRFRRTIEKIKAKNANALLLTRPANVTYLTGFLGRDSWALITARNVYLMTDSRYTEQAQRQCCNCRIIERKKALVDTFVELAGRLTSVKIVALEKDISLELYTRIMKKMVKRTKTVSGLVEEIRQIKDKDEIQTIRTAVNAAANAFEKLRKYLKPGTTENELAGRLEFEMRKADAAASFETIVAFGANASNPHYEPGRTKLKKNDTVLIDFGAKHNGYCCDVTRCFTVGKVSAKYKKAYRTVLSAQQAAIEKVKAGVSAVEVDQAARKRIADSGFPVYGHGTGHGLGLDIHEKPIIAPNDASELKAGQIITIEPGIYIPGQLGIRIEDDVLITDHGCEILSQKIPKVQL